MVEEGLAAFAPIEIPIAGIARECSCECGGCNEGTHCRHVDCYVEEYHPYKQEVWQ